MARNPKPLRRSWALRLRASGWRRRWRLHRRIHDKRCAAMLLRANVRGEPHWLVCEKREPRPVELPRVMPGRVA